MTYLAFFIAALALAVTPGPGLAYVVARTVAGGRTEGLASCLGTGIGGLVHVAAAAVGLSVLVAQSALAFSLVKYIGAVYLIYLGVRMLMSRHVSVDATPVAVSGYRRAFYEGVTVEALNVKTALFFLAFLPQFTTPDAPLASQLVALGAICVVLNTTVDVLAVLGASRLLKSSAAREARARLLKRISGCTMIALGVILASTRRTT